MSETKIYAYFHGEAVYCPDCIAQVFTDEARAFEAPQSAETVLSHFAADNGIDRNDVRSPRASRFPKPLYINEISDADECRICQLPLAPSSH